MAELLDAARKELAEEETSLKAVLEGRAECMKVLNRLTHRRFSFKPRSKNRHTVRVNVKGMTLTHPSGTLFAPFRTLGVLNQKSRWLLCPILSCKFDLPGSTITVRLELRAKVLTEDLPHLWDVKWFKGNTLPASQNVFCLD